MFYSDYCAGHETLGVLALFARESWRQYLANRGDYSVLPTLEEQDNLTDLR